MVAGSNRGADPAGRLSGQSAGGPSKGECPPDSPARATTAGLCGNVARPTIRRGDSAGRSGALVVVELSHAGRNGLAGRRAKRSVPVALLPGTRSTSGWSVGPCSRRHQLSAGDRHDRRRKLMKKFVALYMAPVAEMDQARQNMTPERAKEMTDGWRKWAKSHEKSFVDPGT